MIGLRLDRDPGTILCLGAHPDDIEIGAAGLVRKLAETYPESRFHFAIFTSDDFRRKEAEESGSELLGDRVTVTLGSFTDRYLPYREPGAAKDFLIASTKDLEVDLVLSPHRADAHQDHSFVAALATQVFRDHLILSYELLKYDGDIGRPQLYVPLTEQEVAAKLDHLNRHFPSQHRHQWYTGSVFRSLMAVRGVEAGGGATHAEAFFVNKARFV